jgi:hypothetical protein
MGLARLAAPPVVREGPVREVRIRPRSARRETLFLVAGVLAILGAITARLAWLEPRAPERYLQPYQRLDGALAGPARNLYRSLWASVPEIVLLRDQEGMWPEAELLAAEAVPPFDAQFLPPPLPAYVWLGYDGGSWIDYLGQDPASADTPSFVLRLIDLHGGYHPHPHPGIDYDPNLTVAAQVWYDPQPARPYPGERLPEAGWLWLVRPDDPLLREQPKGPVDTRSLDPTPSRGPRTAAP